MTDTRHTRRTALASIGTVAAAGLAGCQTNLLTSKSTFQQQLDTVRDATEQYTDHRKALEDGFKVMGPFVPGMGWHFIHPDRVKQAAKNGPTMEKPQLLTYDADLNLGSAEWGLPTKAVDESPDLFADDAADATEKWHPHKAATHVLAVPDDKPTNPQNIPPKQFLTNDNWAEFRPPNPDLQPGDTIELHWGGPKAKEKTPKSERIVDLPQTHPDLTTLHAWLHADNPDGVFAPVNPEFAQSMGSGGHDH